MSDMPDTLTEWLLVVIAKIETRIPKRIFVVVDEDGSTQKPVNQESLAELAAKRGAVEAAWKTEVVIDGEWGSGRTREEMEAAGVYPEVVKWLALPYAPYVPGYREEWRP